MLETVLPHGSLKLSVVVVVVVVVGFLTPFCVNLMILQIS